MKIKLNIFLLSALIISVSIIDAQISNAITVNNVTIAIEKGDIIKSKYEAIVNAANKELMRGAGVCGAIFNAAGWQELQDACNVYPENNGIRCPVGQACITDGIKLKAIGIDYIIHAVGPDCRIIKDEKIQNQLLESAYKSSLKIAEKNKIKSIAFPFISSAIYAFPKERAAHIALDTVIEYAKNSNVIQSVKFVLFSQVDFDLFVQIAHQKNIKKRIDTNFYNFKNNCDKLPKFKLKQTNPYKTFLDEHLFRAELEAFFNTTQNQFNKNNWISGKPIIDANKFQAFVEKIIIPVDSIVAIHGDIHGDIHSVNRFIKTFVDHGFLDKNNPFKIKDKKFYILFLGDYGDRGWYGAEVIYAILRLKNENPDNVFIVRGNHEDIDLNNIYGFASEIKSKFSSLQILEMLEQFYNCLPLAIYLGSGTPDNYNFIQCCHGGIEIGFNPNILLETDHDRAGIVINSLRSKDAFEAIAESCKLTKFKQYFHNKNITSDNGFMWNDFIVNPYETLKLSPRDGYQGTMFEFGQLITQELLKIWSGKSYTLRSVFRAHQHGDRNMRDRILNQDGLSHPDDLGLGKLWIQNSIHKNKASLLTDISVITFSVAPNTGYNLPIHVFGQLDMALDYTDWHLHALRM
jgi:O-acetyl-ADP-ribose deacetylase